MGDSKASAGATVLRLCVVAVLIGAAPVASACVAVCNGIVRKWSVRKFRGMLRLGVMTMLNIIMFAVAGSFDELCSYPVAAAVLGTVMSLAFFATDIIPGTPRPAKQAPAAAVRRGKAKGDYIDVEWYETPGSTSVVRGRRR